MNSRERNDLLVSWITLSFAFALVISESMFDLVSLAVAIPIAVVGVGTGFIFHEMAHRQMARRYGFHAEFRAWNNGLILAVVFAIISLGRFTFAAPGATYIFASHLPVDKNGKISVAGPVTNIVLGFVLLFLSLLVAGDFAISILLNAGIINFWLAAFNLLPIGPLDGKKVMAWNMGIWVALIAISGIMALFPGLFFALLGLS